ncbi:MAG: cytochrome c biogenesis protein CcdA [Candidatus Promineifilaceae bacterium]|nr:cytochrome c biogenesis protein CcdA [Candidatus Promineifilaceae bacterium]
MGELVQAFVLGNTAILTNVCVLPLYPGLIAFMAGTSSDERSRRATNLLGLLVLAGVLTLMILIGWLLFAFQRSFGDILPVLLPIIYGVVILMGLLMLSGRNPFARLSTLQAPVLRNPYAAAFSYGLLLGPMTLPCTGPLIVSAFLLGAGSAAGLAENLLYFLVFGLGFGWPLIVLPLFARPMQRRFTGWAAGNHRMLTRVSGVLLILIGLLGFFYDLAPNL